MKNKSSNMNKFKAIPLLFCLTVSTLKHKKV